MYMIAFDCKMNPAERRVQLTSASFIGFVQNGQCILRTFWGHNLQTVKSLVVSLPSYIKVDMK